MSQRTGTRRPEAGEIAEEIIRRGNRLTDNYSGSHVILLSDPPTVEERLQLVGASLQGIAVMVTARHAMTEDEWVERYCTHEKAQADGS